ncbi:MAG: acyl dehydratase [Paraglaciecola sp.]|jgi:acyl dehydratase
MASEAIINTPYATKFEKIGDLEGHLGKELGLSEWITISQERIQKFAESTNDLQWIHVDVERSAKESPYGTTIAHGFLVLSMASAFSYQCYSFENIKMGLNYGLDKVRFMNAVKAGSELRGRISLMEYKAIDGGAKYKLKVVFEIKGVEKPACVAEFVAMVYGE